MRLRLSSLAERVRASLFFVPMTAVLAAVALGFIGPEIDGRIAEESVLPTRLTATVESARALLTTTASATITFAGIAFSISLLIIQQASSQYSPRVIHTLFRDPFNKRVMALVVGTFTYCVVVLRAVQAPSDDGIDPLIPNLSVSFAVVLGIATILAIVAFIDHSAHAMDISEILDRVQRDSLLHIRTEWADSGAGEDDDVPAIDESSCHVVRFTHSGWVQEIDTDALLERAPAESTVRLETLAGRYAIEGTPLCTISPHPDDPDEVDERIRQTVATGTTRTMQQDVSYGLRQLADVALKALSPGINDPTTAQDAIFHSAAVLSELLHRDPPSVTQRGPNGTCLIVREGLSRDDLVELAFAETRRAAASQPAVCIYLLEALALLDESLRADGLDDRTPILFEQARLVVEGCEADGGVGPDVDAVRDAFTKRFTGAGAY